MTVQEARDAIKLRLKSIDENNQFHPKFILFGMSAVFSQLIKEAYQAKDRNLLNYYAKVYTAQTATQNGTTNEYEIDLSSYPLITSKDMGLQGAVREINYHTSRSLNFIPVSAESYSYFDGQDAYNIGTSKVRYELKYNKIIFLSGITVANAATFTGTGLKLVLLVTLDAYTLTEEIPIPDERRDDFFLRVVNFLMGTPPPDQLNDNT